MGRDLDVYFSIGWRMPSSPWRVGAANSDVNAVCKGEVSTSTCDLRVVPGNRPLRNADIHIGRAARQLDQLLSDRQFQAQVAAVTEAQLGAGGEDEGQLSVRRQHLAHVRAYPERAQRGDGGDPARARPAERRVDRD